MQYGVCPIGPPLTLHICCAAYCTAYGLYAASLLLPPRSPSLRSPMAASWLCPASLSRATGWLRPAARTVAKAAHGWLRLVARSPFLWWLPRLEALGTLEMMAMALSQPP